MELPGLRDDPHDARDLRSLSAPEELQRWQDEADEATRETLSLRATLLRGAALVAVLGLLWAWVG